jgi:hypothetical protein
MLCQQQQQYKQASISTQQTKESESDDAMSSASFNASGHISKSCERDHLQRSNSADFSASDSNQESAKASTTSIATHTMHSSSPPTINRIGKATSNSSSTNGSSSLQVSVPSDRQTTSTHNPSQVGRVKSSGIFFKPRAGSGSGGEEILAGTSSALTPPHAKRRPSLKGLISSALTHLPGHHSHAQTSPSRRDPIA